MLVPTPGRIERYQEEELPMAKTPVVELDPRTFDGPEEPDAGEIAATVRIRGRNVTVPDHFVTRIHNKLAPIEKMAPKTITRFDVVLLHEANPRIGDARQRMEITVRSKGGVARAESAEDTFITALDSAVAKLMRQIRKARTRNKISMSGHRRPTSVSEATAGLLDELTQHDASDDAPADPYENDVHDQIPGQVVRRKAHADEPMSVDDALSQMELVGHDFFLFRDVETGLPSVVYRRRAFDYGLLALGEATPGSDERDDTGLVS